MAGFGWSGAPASVCRGIATALSLLAQAAVPDDVGPQGFVTTLATRGITLIGAAIMFACGNLGSNR